MTEENNILKGWTFIKNVANEQEAALVESMLGVEGIPVQSKHRENGNYLEIYMGMSHYGIDLFVPEETVELAKGLLDSELIDMPEETGSEENIKTAAKYEVRRRGIVWIILMYIFLPIIAVIIFRMLFK